MELAEHGITCNAICPGYVRTPLVEGQIKDSAKTRHISKDQVVREVMLGEQPTKRFVTGKGLIDMHQREGYRIAVQVLDQEAEQHV